MSKAADGRDRVLEVIRNAGGPISAGAISKATKITGVFLSHNLLKLYARGDIEPLHTRWGKNIVLHWQIRKPYDVEV